MARVICFLDGTHEVLLQEDDNGAVYSQLERILQERLGNDAVDLLHQVADENAVLADELKSYEASCESYRNCLQDVLDAIVPIMDVLEAKRIDRGGIDVIIRRIATRISNEL